MKPFDGSNSTRRLARRLSLLMFIMMSAVSIVVYLTEERLGIVDFILIIGAPFAVAALAYFVGLRHDLR